MIEPKEITVLMKSVSTVVKDYFAWATAPLVTKFDDLARYVGDVEKAAKIPGPQGIPGEKGADGAIGSQGAPGGNGADGQRGIDGLPGTKGDRGDDGAAGQKGDPGAPGDMGPPGVRGEPGAAGTQGERGNQGESGPSGPAGANGDVGADGAIGPVGPAGAQGSAGADGQVGQTGPVGLQGAQGNAGSPGANGNDGEPGTRGIDGTPGADGKHGINGTDGKPGRDAPDILFIPEIAPDKSYAQGTFAACFGGTLFATRDTDPVHIPAGPKDLQSAGWRVVHNGIDSFSVTQGDDGRSFTVALQTTNGKTVAHQFSVPVMIQRGVWRDGEYEKGDVVTWAGSQWHCEAEKTTTKPGGPEEHWKLIVKKGRDGKDGERGLQGPTGLRGERAA